MVRSAPILSCWLRALPCFFILRGYRFGDSALFKATQPCPVSVLSIVSGLPHHWVTFHYSSSRSRTTARTRDMCSSTVYKSCDCIVTSTEGRGRVYLPNYMLAIPLISHGNRSCQTSYSPPSEWSLDMTSSRLIFETGMLPRPLDSYEVWPIDISNRCDAQCNTRQHEKRGRRFRFMMEGCVNAMMRCWAQPQ